MNVYSCLWNMLVALQPHSLVALLAVQCLVPVAYVSQKTWTLILLQLGQLVKSLNVPLSGAFNLRLIQIGFSEIQETFPSRRSAHQGNYEILNNWNNIKGS